MMISGPRGLERRLPGWGGGGARRCVCARLQRSLAAAAATAGVSWCNTRWDQLASWADEPPSSLRMKEGREGLSETPRTGVVVWQERAAQWFWTNPINQTQWYGKALINGGRLWSFGLVHNVLGANFNRMKNDSLVCHSKSPHSCRQYWLHGIYSTHR